MGRIIRHIDDYGIVVLADERFMLEINKNEMSHWFREKIIINETCTDLIASAHAFLSNIPQNKASQNLTKIN